MLAALWITILLSTLGLSMGLTARQAVATTNNRTELVRLRWLAQACRAIALAELDRAVAAPPARDSGNDVWAHLDRLGIVASVEALGCELAFEPIGTTLDVNHIDSLVLAKVLSSAGLATWSVDSITAAILDWRDADTVPRTAGAERRWYEAALRAGPTNRPFEHSDELALVRGLDIRPEIRGLLGTASEPIVLSHAPTPVLAALPGIGDNVLRVLQTLRSQEDEWTLQDLGGALSEPAAEALNAAMPHLLGRTIPLPEAWRVRIRARSPESGLVQGVSLRVTRGSRRARVEEHRTLHR